MWLWWYMILWRDLQKSPKLRPPPTTTTPHPHGSTTSTPSFVWFFTVANPLFMENVWPSSNQLNVVVRMDISNVYLFTFLGHSAICESVQFITHHRWYRKQINNRIEFANDTPSHIIPILFYKIASMLIKWECEGNMGDLLPQQRDSSNWCHLFSWMVWQNGNGHVLFWAPRKWFVIFRRKCQNCHSHNISMTCHSNFCNLFH